MLNDKLHIIQFNTRTKKISVVSYNSPDQLETINLELIQAAAGDEIKLMSFISNSARRRISKPKNDIIILPFDYSSLEKVLYNYAAYSNPLFCPDGWHIPTEPELTELENYINDSTFSAQYLKLDSPNVWSEIDLTHLNEFKLNLVPSGFRNKFDGVFIQEDTIHIFATLSDFYMDNNQIISYAINQYENTFGSATPLKTDCIAVRLLKNDSVNPGTMTDFEGNIYKTVKIGPQVWTDRNYHCKKYSDNSNILEIVTTEEMQANNQACFTIVPPPAINPK